MSTAEKLGERKIIETIWKHLEKSPEMPVPFGDDVSAVHCGDKKIAVLKTDMLVGKTDVPPQMSWRQAARKAVVMNVSDLAAKGVKPLGIVVSLGIPRNLTRRDVEEIGKGLNVGAREYETYILGGDTNETDDIVISVAVFGLAKEENLILRSGARPGDVVATTGLFGLTSPGIKILTEKLIAPPKIREKLVDSVLTPHARLREGLALAQTRAATAAIDSSDGLAWSLHELSDSSKVGFVIDKPPVAPETYEFARIHNFDPLELSLYGGEEYELIVTVTPKLWKKAEEAVARCKGSLMKIGRVTAENTLLLKHGKKTVKVEARGYEHFKREEATS